jgi:hypothetical protein
MSSILRTGLPPHHSLLITYLARAAAATRLADCSPARNLSLLIFWITADGNRSDMLWPPGPGRFSDFNCSYLSRSHRLWGDPSRGRPYFAAGVGPCRFRNFRYLSPAQSRGNRSLSRGRRLLRYAGRPPVATERLSLLPDGRLLYRLRRRWRDGTSHVIFEPLEFIGKLAALVPPPRFHVVRYYGILAPAAAWRSLVVPESEAQAPLPHSGCPAKNNPPAETGNPKAKGRCRPRNYAWSELLKRVFSFDILVCERCGGRMKVLCAVHPPNAIRKILDCLGLPSRPPPRLPRHRRLSMIRTSHSPFAGPGSRCAKIAIPRCGFGVRSTIR